MTNSRFEDLERRALKIRRTRMAKIIFFFAFVSMIPFVYFYFTFKDTAQNNAPPSSTSLSPEVKVQVPAVEVKTEEQVDKNMTVVEENNTIQSDKYDTLLLSPNVKHNAQKVPVEETINLEPPSRSRMKDFDGKEEKKSPEEIKKMINMSVRSLGEEEALLKNFNSNGNYKTSYSLAEYYFNKKEYGKAVSWSKEASKLDPTSESPWIIYAKSKFYLGEKIEAVQALEVFLSYASSKEAKELLNFYKGQL